MESLVLMANSERKKNKFSNLHLLSLVVWIISFYPIFGQETRPKPDSSYRIEIATPEINQAPKEIKWIDNDGCCLETPPAFIGGEKALDKFLSKKIRKRLRAAKITVIEPFKIQVRFFVNEDGSISDVMVKDSLIERQTIIALLIKSIQEMPNWEPGKNCNGFIRFPISIPILIDSNKKN